MAKLTDLPNELIDEIVELMYAANPKQYLGAVHRVFLASSRSVTFREVRTKPGTHSLWQLCKLVSNTPSAAASLRVLSISNASNWDARLSGQDYGVPLGPTKLRSLFRQLNSVEELHIRSEALAKLILKPTSTGEVFPRLHFLKIEYSDVHVANPFDPRRFTHLDRYPLLDALELAFPSYLGSDSEHRPYRGRLATKRSWWITLRGWLGRNAAVPDLISLFNIDSLTLHDISPVDAFSPTPILRAVRYKGNLSALAVRHLGLHDAVDPALLATFPNLSSLTLDPATLSPSGLAALSSLTSLTRLVFGPNSLVSSADLVPLLSGPNKLPSLRTLRLDVVHKPHSDFYAVDPLAYSGWTSSFTLKGVGELLDLAEKEDIKLTGLAVALVKREREYERRFGKAGSRATR
ncbi:hypothetical protein JCM8097_004202 [Rhodosporidiobolus ruineniae]